MPGLSEIEKQLRALLESDMVLARMLSAGTMAALAKRLAPHIAKMVQEEARLEVNRKLKAAG